MENPQHIAGLSEREAISDVLYRATLAIDVFDQDLWDSAWASHDTACIVFDGLSKVGSGVQEVFDRIGPLATSHHVSNIRIQIHDSLNTATATALALHQHYRATEGLQPDSKNLLAARRYNCELEKFDGLWKMTKWEFKTVWNQGDPVVMPW